MKDVRRILCLALCCTLVLGCFPLAAFAENGNHNGLCTHHTEHVDCNYAENETDCSYICDLCSGSQETVQDDAAAATAQDLPGDGPAVCTGGPDHNWEAASCTEAKHCTLCSLTEGEALGHEEVVDEAVEPTAATAGKTEGSHCSRCGLVLIAQTPVAATEKPNQADPEIPAMQDTAEPTEGISVTAEAVSQDVQAAAVTGSHYSHAACGATCIHEETHDSVTFNRWTSGSFSSGNYYMDGNITLYKSMTVTGEAHLCLNGYTLTIADGYGLTVEKGGSLTICDCVGNGQILRGTLAGNSDSSMLANRGEMTIFGGSYGLDGRGVNLYNTGTLTVFDGTFGIAIGNNYDDWSSSTTSYGSLTVYNATMQCDLYSTDNAITNDKGCSLTIYDGDFSARGHVVWNGGYADIKGGKIACISTETYNSFAGIYNCGTLNLSDTEVTSKIGFAIHNAGYWNTNRNYYYSGYLSINNGTTVTSESATRAAIYNTGDVTVNGGTISGYMGIENNTAQSGTDKDGGESYVRGGTITGTKCAVYNNGSFSVQYQNGLPWKNLISRGILEVSGKPAMGKVLLRFPSSLVIDSNCTAVVDLEVDPEYIAVGDTISTGSINKLPNMNLLNEGYTLLYNSSKSIYLETNHCGATDADDLHWKVSADGTLTIFGTGKMKNFGFSSDQPWNKNKTGVAINQIVLEPGITHIGEASFSYTEGLTKIVIPEGVTTTGDFVFEGNDNLEEVHLPSTLTSVGRCFFSTIGGTQPPAAVYYNGCAHQWAEVSVESPQPAPVNPICLPNENKDDGDCTTELRCSVCDAVQTPAQENHTGGTASCYTKAECTVCGKAYGDFAHVPVTVPAEAPGCEKTGLTEGVKCDLCGAELVKQTVVPATDHNYEAVVTAPTCENKGYTTYTCHCGNTYTGNEVDALKHDLGNWVTDKDETCTEPGSKTKHCQRTGCNYFEEEEIPFDGHKHEAVVTAPTCEEKGYTTYTCHCGDTYTADEVDALKHEMGDWKTTKAATCTEDGSKTRNCKRTDCDHSETEKIPQNGHDHKTAVTAPTCTEKGYTTYTCHCGDTYTADEVDAMKHDLGNWVTGKEPTCTAEGSKTRSCQRTGCGHTETEKIPATDHNHESVVTAPTCTGGGYTTHTCACGDTYTDSKVAALGHNMGKWQTVKAATCKNDGSQKRICQRTGCDHSETKKISATGKHTYTNSQDTTCNVCGDKRTVKVETIPVYRLYNPYTQEHLLTGGAEERDALISIGWSLDGVAWEAPKEGIPVYRLYNPYDDWHTYTTSESERDTMVAAGWTVDGVVSFGYTGKDGRPIYRLFNPYVQTNYHLFTAGAEERDQLVSVGWILEGTAWYAVK